MVPRNRLHASSAFRHIAIGFYINTIPHSGGGLQILCGNVNALLGKDLVKRAVNTPGRFSDASGDDHVQRQRDTSVVTADKASSRYPST